MSENPYSKQPTECFWSTGVKGQNWARIERIYVPRFQVNAETRIMTAGSCFAQHIGAKLKSKGFNVLDLEPPPRGLRGEAAQRFGYNLYSARYGNIYTARQLYQVAASAFGRFSPGVTVWAKGDKFVDALRPNVEPEGLDTEREVRKHRHRHLISVKKAIESTDVFIFTFGLTEAWVHTASDTVLPVVPGSSAGGCFDSAAYSFRNFTTEEVFSDFVRFRKLAKSANPAMKFLVTVSPVPLVATATSQHVLLATSYSKSVLRAVCGKLYEQFEDVDYFPSYEMITAPFSRQFFYDEETLRNVRPDAVEMVMGVFFRAHGIDYMPPLNAAAWTANEEDKVVVCEEMLLEAFAQNREAAPA